MIKCFLINGSAKNGKDEFIKLVEKEIADKISDWAIVNFSTIDGAKEAAKILGWDVLDKSNEARELLSDIQDARNKFNDGGNQDAIDLVKLLNQDAELYGEDILCFIHCREPHNIKYLCTKISSICPIKTILIERPGHNVSSCSKDDIESIKSIDYDICYSAKTKEELKECAIKFVYLEAN